MLVVLPGHTHFDDDILALNTPLLPLTGAGAVDAGTPLVARTMCAAAAPGGADAVDAISLVDALASAYTWAVVSLGLAVLLQYVRTLDTPPHLTWCLRTAAAAGVVA